MSLILGLGSNLGDRSKNINDAISNLCEHYKLVAQSRIYVSKAVDYTNQPDFFNLAIEFQIPPVSCDEVMKNLLGVEKLMGRQRDIPKGPRVIDIDLLFFGLEKNENDTVIVPHPRLFQRSFVVRPLGELPFFETLQKHYDFTNQFEVDAHPLEE